MLNTVLFMNVLNSSDTNFGPLSPTSCCGRPKWLMIDLSSSMILSEEVLLMMATLGHLLWALTTTKKHVVLQQSSKVYMDS